MVPIIIAIILIVIFLIYLISVYLSDLLHLIINFPIIWVVVLRSYFEIRHKKIFYPYMISLAVTIIIHLSWFNNLRPDIIWWPVWFITIMWVFAEIIQILEYLYRGHIKIK